MNTSLCMCHHITRNDLDSKNYQFITIRPPIQSYSGSRQSGEYHCRVFLLQQAVRQVMEKIKYQLISGTARRHHPLHRMIRTSHVMQHLHQSPDQFFQPFVTPPKSVATAN